MSARPNVLFVLTDQQKADSLALYGNSVCRTPALDSLAETGVTFDGCICNYPACTPGRSALMTGRYPHTTGVRANHLHLPAHELTLPLLLKATGYRLGLVGKNHVLPDGTFWSQFRVGMWAAREFENAPRSLEAEDELRAANALADHSQAFDTWYTASHFGPEGPEFAELRAFATRPEHWRSLGGSGALPFPAEETTSLVLGSRAADFIRESADSPEPWFLWLSFPDPHNPYLTPEPYASMYDRATVDLPPDDPMIDKPQRHAIAKRMSGMHGECEQVVREAVAIQLGQVTGIDDGLSIALRALDETGQRENTIVIFTTDHGGCIGDHGVFHKSLAFFDCLVRLPLVVSWPGTISPGRMHNGFVEQIDILPTVLELTGVTLPPGLQGRSVAAVFAGGTADALRDAAFSEGGEAGDPITWEDLPFLPDGPLDTRYLGWDGFREAWLGQGKMICTEAWKYVWWASGEEELYDRRNDPDELVNLAVRADPETEETKRMFRDRLLLWSVTSEDQLAPHAFNVYFDDVVAGRLPW